MRLLRNGKYPRAVGLVATVLSLGLVTAACGGGAASGGNGKPTINIGYINWNEDVATTYMWKHILEERGYKVKLKELKAAPLFQGMARGDLDIFLDTWLPSTHKEYWAKYGDELAKLTPSGWYEGATLELAVPTYMKKTNSITDLKKISKKLGGEITGIGAGAGESDIIKKKVIPAYNLGEDYRYAASSTATMLAALKRAITNKDPIVVALWHPHYAYKAFDIKDLKDPKKAWPGGEKIYVTANKDFTGTYPKITKWMKKYKLTDKQLSSLSNQVFNKAEDPQAREKAAAEWVKSHQSLVQSWGIPKAS